MCMWNVSTTEEFDAWFSELGEYEQAEVIAKVELLRLLGAAACSSARRHSTRIARQSCRLAAKNPREPEALLPATNHQGRRTLRCAPGENANEEERQG
jgi:hypothetical protein